MGITLLVEAIYSCPLYVLTGDLPSPCDAAPRAMIARALSSCHLPVPHASSHDSCPAHAHLCVDSCLFLDDVDSPYPSSLADADADSDADGLGPHPRRHCVSGQQACHLSSTSLSLRHRFPCPSSTGATGDVSPSPSYCPSPPSSSPSSTPPQPPSFSPPPRIPSSGHHRHGPQSTSAAPPPLSTSSSASSPRPPPHYHSHLPPYPSPPSS